MMMIDDDDNVCIRRPKLFWRYAHLYNLLTGIYLSAGFIKRTILQITTVVTQTAAINYIIFSIYLAYILSVYRC